mmetsp:Transcript_85477/g.227058  ORF Transcript_85477/g.227058 Transcript_85477/m.227058 type:complete len:273 (+) Transcript_85477:165-983(+)
MVMALCTRHLPNHLGAGAAQLHARQALRSQHLELQGASQAAQDARHFHVLLREGCPRLVPELPVAHALTLLERHSLDGLLVVAVPHVEAVLGEHVVVEPVDRAAQDVSCAPRLLQCFELSVACQVASGALQHSVLLLGAAEPVQVCMAVGGRVPPSRGGLRALHRCGGPQLRVGNHLIQLHSRILPLRVAIERRAAECRMSMTVHSSTGGPRAQDVHGISQCKLLGKRLCTHLNQSGRVLKRGDRPQDEAGNSPSGRATPKSSHAGHEGLQV